MNNHHTKTKGDLGLVKTITDLAEKDYKILLPISEHLPFDLVAYKNSKLYRIQVKYVSGESAYIPSKTSWTDKKGSHSKKYDENDFDYYAIYLPDLDKIIYPNLSFGEKRIRTTLPSTFTPFYWWEDFLSFTDNANKRKLKEFGITTTYKKVIEQKQGPNYKLRKVKRPSKDELQKLLWEKPTIQLAKEFGVSDKAIEKWAKSYGIEKPPRGYWSKMIAQNGQAVNS